MTDAPSKTPIRELIEAVEAGTSLPMDGSAYRLFGDGWLHVFDAYHGSLDAAKALHDALLPGWRMDALWQGGHLCSNENDWSCRLRCVSEQRHAVENDERQALPNPARAWLIAILRAYEAQQ